MPTPTQAATTGLVARLLGRLRFPQLFAVVALLFLVNLLVPDFIPFVDEILLGALTLLLGSWKDRGAAPSGEKPPEKDVTPRSEPPPAP